MTVYEKKFISETFRVCAMLAVVGGFLDAYTYICRGQVFCNSQTGNIVLIAIAFSEYNFSRVFHHLIPVISFIVGVVLTEVIRTEIKPKIKIFHWKQFVIGSEILILFITAFIPMAKYDWIVNIAISFICAMQVQAFRKVHDIAIVTTMCTGNLRTATEHMYKSIIEKDKAKMTKSIEAYGIVGFFIVGAIVGAVLTNLYMEKAAVFAVVILGIVFFIMFKKTQNVVVS